MASFGDTFSGAANGLGGDLSSAWNWAGKTLGDVGDSFMGHAAYAPGGQWGTNAGANAYAQGMQNLGAAQQGQFLGMGSAANTQAQALGANTAARMYGLGDRLGAQQPTAINYGTANQALGAQNDALAMYQRAAAGQGPSAAQAQLQAGNDAAMRAQMSAAANARGAGLANAQHDAAQNMALANQQNANAAAQLRAQEQQAAMSGYANQAATIQGQQAQNAQAQAQLTEQGRQNAAQNQLQAYGLGASNQLGYNQLGANNQLGYAQLGGQQALGFTGLGQQALSGQLSADVANQQSTNQQMAGNAGRQQQGLGSIMNMAGGFLGML